MAGWKSERQSPDLPHKDTDTDRDALEGLEAAIQPDVDGGADGGGPTIEGVGDHEEVVRSDREELPVVRPGRGQSLIHLKQLEGQRTKEGEI